MTISVRRLVALVAVALTAAGCGSDSSTGANKPGPATRLELVTSPPATAAAASSAGSFTVKVSDSKGVPVPGVTVAFTATGAVTVSPASVVTDANGQATAQITAGTIAGSASVSASVTGIPVVVSATVTIIAGAATKMTVTPKTLRFANVGDTARISASALDQYGNAAAANAITFTVVDPSLVSVDQAGLVRVLRLGGTTFVIASSGSKADTTAVNVLAAGVSICTGLATAPQMKVGDVQIFSGSQYACLSGSTAGAEYTLLAFNSSTDQVNSLSASILGQGLTAAPSPYKAPIPGPMLMRSSLGTAGAVPPEPDERFHTQLLQRANDELSGRIARTRDARRAAISRSTFGSASATQAAVGVLPATVQVGDLITMNVSAAICTNPVYHAMRVTAVGSKSIVLADTLNPTPGFSATDYLRFAANFDTLVYAMDVAAFGAPSDFDQNGRVGILFTRTVNELVNASSGYFVGGFFNPRDLFPKKGATAADDCPGSNEGEMFYMVVPAPAPGINGVTHTTGFVDSLTTGVLAHEFQHLINAGRRLYVNNAAQDFEEVWLNEGLSHIAEELLYYRQSG
ncbi:MAG TPA: Ig-like domain-containing protein, partial [Gemmatimonadaceae bacterium]